MNFEQVYNDYFGRVYSYIRARVYNENQSDDICSEVWQTVFEKQDTFDKNKGNIEQWLFTIARNKVNGHFRFYHIKNMFSLSDKEDTFPSAEHQPLQELDKLLHVRSAYCQKPHVSFLKTPFLLEFQLSSHLQALLVPIHPSP